MFRLRICFLLAAMIFPLTGGIRSANSQPAPAGDDYTTLIQPIFDNRCIACHSCYNAPCQLNLQSYSGLARGATKLNVYDRSRPKSVAPSRLDIDGRSVSDWRAKGFFDMVGGTEPARTLLMQLLGLRARHPTVQPKKPVAESNFCPADSDNAALVSQSTPELGMPYGLPPLSQAKMEVLSEWIARGAPGPERPGEPAMRCRPRCRPKCAPGRPSSMARRRARSSWLVISTSICSWRISISRPSRRPGARNSSAWCAHIRHARRASMRSRRGGRTTIRALANSTTA